MDLKLRFRARGGKLVPHYGAIDAVNKRYIGRQWDPSLADPKRNIAGGWVATPEGEEVIAGPITKSEYAMHCREEALWPADEETAKALGVKFDPTFGGEFESHE